MEKQKEEYSTFASSVVWAIRIVKNKIKKNYIGFYHPTPRPPTIKEFRILTYICGSWNLPEKQKKITPIV